jgi:hypothetical protein
MPTVEIESQVVAYPLVGVISPWNAPLMLALLDAVPALFAGSAVLLKPSEVTPRVIETLFETVREVPELAAVFDYATGPGEVGQAVIAEADTICFTGSVPTGRKVAVACAERLIPCNLELGGKDPCIVTASADLEPAHTLAELLDHARAFVAEHDRLRRMAAGMLMEVGVADAGGDQADAHFTGARFFLFKVLERGRITDPAADGGSDLHSGLPR